MSAVKDRGVAGQGRSTSGSSTRSSWAPQRVKKTIATTKRTIVSGAPQPQLAALGDRDQERREADRQEHRADDVGLVEVWPEVGGDEDDGEHQREHRRHGAEPERRRRG